MNKNNQQLKKELTSYLELKDFNYDLLINDPKKFDKLILEIKLELEPCSKIGISNNNLNSIFGESLYNLFRNFDVNMEMPEVQKTFYEPGEVILSVPYLNNQFYNILVKDIFEIFKTESINKFRF